MTTSIKVNPGICGFTTSVSAEKIDKRCVRLVIGSDCLQVKNLASKLHDIKMFELFKPVQLCPLYTYAVECMLHPSCAVPLAVLKAAECELGLALPKDVVLEFVK